MKVLLTLVAVAYLALTPVTAANAAPQILGIFTTEALPMHCVDGLCSTEVSAICLQEGREIPALGTAYRPIQPDRLKLVGAGVDGGRIEASVGGIARIETARGSWAVRISLPESALKSFGGAGATLSINGRVTLLPAPVPGDLAPQSHSEIEDAVAAFDKSPDSIASAAAPGMAAATVMTDMINTLPHVALDPAKPGGDLWRRTFGATSAARPGIREAAAFYRMCSDPMLVVERDTMRRCLEYGHAGFVAEANRRYWESLRPEV